MSSAQLPYWTTSDMESQSTCWKWDVWLTGSMTSNDRHPWRQSPRSQLLPACQWCNSPQLEKQTNMFTPNRAQATQSSCFKCCCLGVSAPFLRWHRCLRLEVPKNSWTECQMFVLYYSNQWHPAISSLSQSSEISDPESYTSSAAARTADMNSTQQLMVTVMDVVRLMVTLNITNHLRCGNDFRISNIPKQQSLLPSPGSVPLEFLQQLPLLRRSLRGPLLGEVLCLDWKAVWP